MDNLQNEIMRIRTDKPRAGKNFESAGSYQLASKVYYNVVDPGGVLEFDQFITGYGLIGNSKIFCFVSDSVFEKENSFCTHSLMKNKMGVNFGGIKQKIDASGFHCQIAGLKLDNWESSTSYFDLSDAGDDSDKACPIIATEVKMLNPPFSFKLKLKNKVLPGDYSMDFYFTYFNGEKWVCTKESVKFKVRSFLERHAPKLSYFGVAATLSGLALGLVRLLIS